MSITLSSIPCSIFFGLNRLSMAKQIIHLLLFIALVGQNILSPAMAMPEFLHSMSHKAAEQSISLQKFPSAEQAAGLDSNASTDLVTIEGEFIQCDLPCIILASGHCVTHCAAMTGIVIHSSMNLMQLTSSEPIPNHLWSIQTVDASQAYRPPIA